jgi:hypothetical protein
MAISVKTASVAAAVEDPKLLLPYNGTSKMRAHSRDGMKPFGFSHDKDLPVWQKDHLSLGKIFRKPCPKLLVGLIGNLRIKELDHCRS